MQNILEIGEIFSKGAKIYKESEKNLGNSNLYIKGFKQY